MQAVLAAAVMFVSGACALAWQMVWNAGFAVAFGHEVAAVLGVMGAFFGGLAIGAFALAAPIERSARPALWYVALEVVIAAWGMLLALVLPELAPSLARALGAQPGAALHAVAAFGVPLVLLAPATIAMGATLPALERTLRGAVRISLPWLYGSNTAGALTGVLLATFTAIPAAGLRATAWSCAAANAACAIVVWAVWHAQRVGPDDDVALPMAGSGRIGVLLFATGLLGIGYEVLAVRVLSQVCENTTFTYALLLAAFLLGTAGGAALLRRMAPAQEAWATLTDSLLLALAAAVVVCGTGLWWADRVQALPVHVAGASLASALAGEALAGLFAMLLPSVAMGALFSLLCLRARAAGRPLGRAIGINTSGAALAPIVVGAWLFPAVGAKPLLLLIAAAYLALASRAGWRTPAPAFAALAIALVAAFAPPLRFVDVPAGGRVLSHRDGTLASVSVVADANDVARLHINNRVQEGSSASGMMEMRLAQLPLLLHNAPAGVERDALFLGLGTGYTANAAAVDPRVHVTAVELLPEVIDASSAFMLRPAAPRAARPVDTIAADARRFVLAGDSRHDVIVADLFHPARSGAGSLYTVEHFRAVRERLAPGGLFCQWLALHQMDLDTLRSIVAAFMEVYPEGVAVLGGNGLDTPVIGLVATPGARGWRLADMQARLAAQQATSPAMAAALATARIDSAFAVLGSVLADASSLRAFAGSAAPNTDDLPRVAAQAARVDYAPEAAPRQRLAALLHMLSASPQAVLAPGDPHGAKLEAYWHARARYLEVGMQLEPDPDPRGMLDKLGPPLLEIVKASPEFLPAADSLAALAKAVEASDYPLSQRVLAALRRAQGAIDPNSP